MDEPRLSPEELKAFLERVVMAGSLENPDETPFIRADVVDDQDLVALKRVYEGYPVKPHVRRGIHWILFLHGRLPEQPPVGSDDQEEMPKLPGTPVIHPRTK